MLHILASVLLMQLVTLSSDAVRIEKLSSLLQVASSSSKVKSAALGHLAANGYRQCPCHPTPCYAPDGKVCDQDASMDPELTPPIVYVDGKPAAQSGGEDTPPIVYVDAKDGKNADFDDAKDGKRADFDAKDGKSADFDAKDGKNPHNVGKNGRKNKRTSSHNHAGDDADLSLGGVIANNLTIVIDGKLNVRKKKTSWELPPPGASRMDPDAVFPNF